MELKLLNFHSSLCSLLHVPSMGLNFRNGMLKLANTPCAWNLVNLHVIETPVVV